MTSDRSDDAPEGGSIGPTKVIKRYSNRKLYDTDRSKYVTLDEIARMIKAGEEVTIIDNETKEDLTSVTLTQIIFEEEKRESRMPLGMLRNLIQTGGETLQDFFDRSVKTPVSEIKGSAQKSVETLRDAATRSVSEWTDTARRVFTRDAEAKHAEEFRKAWTLALDDLAKRIETRVKEIQSLREQGNHPVAPEPDSNGALPTNSQDLLRAQEDLQALRARLHDLGNLIDELERAGQ